MFYFVKIPGIIAKMSELWKTRTISMVALKVCKNKFKRLRIRDDQRVCGCLELMATMCVGGQ